MFKRNLREFKIKIFGIIFYIIFVLAVISHHQFIKLQFCECFQGYALCVLDYDFLILDNAFLVHRPGIKIFKKDPHRDMLTAKTNALIKKIIMPELKVLYGTRKGCAV